MKIRVGFEMIYDFPQPTPLIRKGCLKVMVSRRERVVMPRRLSQTALRRHYCCACIYRALFWPD